jgi:hypothetical protein
MCTLSDHKEGLLIEGRCDPIDWRRVLPIGSPDGGAHACWRPADPRHEQLCVILPGET